MYMHRGSWKSSSFPRIAGVQWSNTVGSTLWGMASGVALVLGIELCRARLVPHCRFPQCRHSVRDGGAVTGVGGRDSGHSHCGEWRPNAV